MMLERNIGGTYTILFSQERGGGGGGKGGGGREEPTLVRGQWKRHFCIWLSGHILNLEL